MQGAGLQVPGCASPPQRDIQQARRDHPTGGASSSVGSSHDRPPRLQPGPDLLPRRERFGAAYASRISEQPMLNRQR